MKHQYFRVLVSLLLILGLCSCKSDKSEEVSEAPVDSFGVKDVDYIHKDKSIHKINDTKELAIDSRIQLSLNDTDEQDFTLKTSTRCYGGTLRDNYYHNQTWKNQTSIKVTSLLPIEAFQPLLSENNQILCDFDMKITNLNGSETTIELKDIKITQLFQFYDMNIMDDGTPNIPFFILENELDRVLSFPWDQGNVYLICENNLNTLVAENSEVPFHLIKDYDFLNNEVNFCRLVFETSDKKQRKIGRYFYLQKEATQVSVKILTDFPDADSSSQEISIDFNNKAFASLKIHNEGKTKVYIPLDNLQPSQLELLSLYMSGSFLTNAYYSHATQKTVQWIPNSNTVEKNGSRYLEILPGETGSIKAISQGKLSCGVGQIPTSWEECHITAQYHGYLINIHNLPSLQVNKNSSLEYMDWTPVTFKSDSLEKTFFNNNYQFWKGNPTNHDACKVYPKKNANLPEKIVNINPSSMNIFSCQMN
jgi:hypothetical protein